MGRDPVCFADVDEVDAAREGLISHQNDRVFYFCSEACKSRFEKDPGAFMGDQTPSASDDEFPDNYIG